MNEKIQKSIKILQQNEPAEGYHLAFSGGKDSICIYELAKISRVKFTPYFCMTTVDPPELLLFIKKYYPEISWLKPKLSMFQLIEKKGLPSRFSRYCCEFLKEYAGAGEHVILGIRKAESKKRSAYTETMYDERTKKNKVLPILDWSDDNVWQFIKDRKLYYPEIYTDCKTRIGCIGCPMSLKNQRIEFEKYPRFKNAYLIAIRKAKKRGLMKSFIDENEAFRWWTSGLKLKDFKAKDLQTKLKI